MRADFSTVFFDLDGTLADNYEAIALGVGKVLKPMGITPPSLEKVRQTVGGSILITFEKLIGKELAQKAAAQYMEIIGECELEGLRPMPYSAEILALLKSRGIRTALFTNKGQKSAEHIARHLGFDKYLDAVFGTSLNGARKPEAAFTQNALRAMKAASSESLIIGDSPYDYKAARVCEAASCLVATGANSAKELRKECPEARVFKNLEELSQKIFP
ncbi:MAG: HAD family hydrolase [Opitutales bacterium]|nr:HAD family hydrolase [Opitutales bacterium]